MHDRRLDDAALDRLLADASHGFAFPPTPTFALPARRASASRRLVVALALGILVALAAASVAAGALGIGPLRVIFTDQPPEQLAPPASASRLALGRLTTLMDPAIGVPLLAPPDLDVPQAYVSADGARASLVWGSTAELPPAGASNIGLLVMAISGDMDRAWLEKLVDAGLVTIEDVTVRGEPGLWIHGPHVLRFRHAGADGDEASRLVGDALVWSDGTTLYRVESGLGRDATIALADGMMPVRR